MARAATRPRRTDRRPDWTRKRVQAPENTHLYGLHPVMAALRNPERKSNKLLATLNAQQRLKEAGIALPGDLPLETVEARAIDRKLTDDAVHQGLYLECEPLPEVTLEEVMGAPTLLLLDQVTDPHNIGAILRSAAAFGAGALITTLRNAAPATAVLAKSAAGALDILPWVQVRNLNGALETLGAAGYQRLGLAEEGEAALGSFALSQNVALVLGSEGKGLRPKTRENCDKLVSIPLDGPLQSLNVSNAAAVALFAAAQGDRS